VRLLRDPDHDDMARMLKEMNFVSVSMGLESGNQEVLTRLRDAPSRSRSTSRRSTPCVGTASTRTRRSSSGAVRDPRQMEETYQFIRRNPLSLVNIYVLTPLPGTPVWHDARARGLVSDDMDWDLLNISFELDWQRVILVSQTVTREELHRMYQRLRRLRLSSTPCDATHPSRWTSRVRQGQGGGVGLPCQIRVVLGRWRDQRRPQEAS